MTVLASKERSKQRTFDALCQVAIYNFCDMCYREGAPSGWASKYLVRHRVIQNSKDIQTARDKYIEAVEEYALERFPADYFAGRDYWGARCIMRPGDSSQDKSLPFHGDQHGEYMFFANWASMVDYADRKLKELGHE